MCENQYTELVINYYEGNFCQKERLMFERELENNSELKKEYENQSKMNKMLSDKTLYKLVDDMKQIELNLDS